MDISLAPAVLARLQPLLASGGDASRADTLRALEDLETIFSQPLATSALYAHLARAEGGGAAIVDAMLAAGRRFSADDVVAGATFKALRACVDAARGDRGGAVRARARALATPAALALLESPARSGDAAAVGAAVLVALLVANDEQGKAVADAASMAALVAERGVPRLAAVLAARWRETPRIAEGVSLVLHLMGTASTDSRTEAVAAGALPPLVGALELWADDVPALRGAAAALMVLVNFSPHAKAAALAEGAPRRLVGVLRRHHRGGSPPSVLTGNVCAALASLTAGVTSPAVAADLLACDGWAALAVVLNDACGGGISAAASPVPRGGPPPTLSLQVAEAACMALTNSVKIAASILEKRAWEDAVVRAGAVAALLAAQRGGGADGTQRVGGEALTWLGSRSDALLVELGTCEAALRRSACYCASGACPNVPTNVCGGCNATHYCGEACQGADWRAGHKTECKALRRTRGDGDA